MSNNDENIIILKFREKSKGENTNALLSNKNDKDGVGSRREKERKIGEVVLKVSKWRGLYNKNKTLEEAAKDVEISKKSLDDYFLQLKNG